MMKALQITDSSSLQIEVRWDEMLKRFKTSNPRPLKDRGPQKDPPDDIEMPPKDVWGTAVRAELGEDSSN